MTVRRCGLVYEVEKQLRAMSRTVLAIKLRLGKLPTIIRPA